MTLKTIPLEEAEREDRAKSCERGSVEFRRFSEIVLGPITPYVIKGMIGEREIVVMFAPPKKGKTFMGGHFGHCVATGRKVFGRRVKKMPVVFFALEGGSGIAGRVEAYRSVYGDASDLHIHSRPLALFENPDLVDEVIDKVNRVKAKFVIIDTLARVMVGGNENTQEDMAKMFAVFERIRDATGAAILVIHHTGKDEARGMRGSNVLLANVSGVLEITKPASGPRLLTLTEMRDGPSDIAYEFELEVIPLKDDEEGDPRSSCVVRELSDKPIEARAKDKTDKLTAGDAQALDWLQRAINAGGVKVPGEPDYVRGVTFDQWRAEGRKRSGKDADTVRKQIDRAVTKMTAMNMIGVNEPHVWLL